MNDEPCLVFVHHTDQKVNIVLQIIYKSIKMENTELKFHRRKD